MNSSSSNRIWVASELYWPEATSTGHAMTLLAESLSSEAEVHAICVQPTYSASGVSAAKQEVHNGVRIDRVPAWAPKGNSPFAKAIRGLSIATSIGLGLSRRCGKGDTVVVVSNPLVLPILAMAVCKLRRCRLVLVTHDLFPDVLVAGGLLKEGGVPARALKRASLVSYRSAYRIVSIGESQRDRLIRLDPSLRATVHVVAQAADLDLLEGTPAVETASRTIQLAGNLGPLQDIANLGSALSEMDLPAGLRFGFVGDGRERAAIEALIAGGRIPAEVQDPVPRAEVNEVHRACDIAMVILKPGMVGVSVPSRIGNVLASGRPVLCMTGSGSELHELVVANDLGWVVEPGNWDQLERTFESVASALQDQLVEMGLRSRRAALDLYSSKQMANSYRAAILGFSREGRISADRSVSGSDI